jgi:transcriptional regulator with XRE-family HTH domain
VKISEVIKQERKRQNLTQRQLALKAQVTPSGLSQIETGRRGASFEMIRKISTALGCSMDAMVEGRAAAVPSPGNLREIAENVTREAEKIRKMVDSIEGLCES